MSCATLMEGLLTSSGTLLYSWCFLHVPSLNNRCIFFSPIIWQSSKSSSPMFTLHISTIPGSNWNHWSLTYLGCPLPPGSPLSCGWQCCFFALFLPQVTDTLFDCLACVLWDWIGPHVPNSFIYVGLNHCVDGGGIHWFFNNFTECLLNILEFPKVHRIPLLNYWLNIVFKASF